MRRSEPGTSPQFSKGRLVVTSRLVRSQPLLRRAVEDTGPMDAMCGSGHAPRTLAAGLAKIKSGEVVLLPAQMADGSTRTINLRCVTTPDEAQKILLNHLGLVLPRRLRRIDEVAQT